MSNKVQVPKLRFKGFEDEWESYKLKDVANFSKGMNFTKQDLVSKDQGAKPIILYGSLYTNYQLLINEVSTFTNSDKKAVLSEKADVIVPSSGESSEDIARASVIRKPGIIIGGDLNIIKIKSKLDAAFLALTISNGKQKKELMKRSQGKSVVHLRNDDLKQVAVIAPQLLEQQKIGEFFVNFDKLKECYNKKIELLTLYKKSILQKMFSKNNPMLRFAGFNNSWEKAKLKDIVEWDKGNNLSKSVLSSDSNLNPVLHYGDLYSLPEVIKETIHYSNSKQGKEIAKNSLLFPMSDVTPRGLARTSAVVNSGIKAGSDILIGKIPSGYSATFLSYQINYNSNQILKYITGTTIRHINSKSLDLLTLELPSLDEQRKIANFLCCIDSYIEKYVINYEKIEKLKSAYLQKMFC